MLFTSEFLRRSSHFCILFYLFKPFTRKASFSVKKYCWYFGAANWSVLKLNLDISWNDYSLGGRSPSESADCKTELIHNGVKCTFYLLSLQLRFIHPGLTVGKGSFYRLGFPWENLWKN